MIEVTRIDYIRVPVDDIEAAKHFYGEVLGLPRNEHLDHDDWIEYEASNVTLAVMTPETHDYAFAPLPPATPLSNPSSGTPAVVLDDQEVSTILGKRVRSSADEDMGRIVDIIVNRDGQIHAAIIDFGGLLGIGTRKIAVDWRVLNFAPAAKPGAIILQLTRNQVRLAPEYKRGEPVVVVGAGSPERTMPPSEIAAPER